jgi:DNA-binding transcriptional regulator YhcF (GntR family)
METGHYPTGSRLSTIRKLAEALGVDPHELLKEEYSYIRYLAYVAGTGGCEFARVRRVSAWKTKVL